VTASAAATVVVIPLTLEKGLLKVLPKFKKEI
jgi:hypothetical protein